MVRLRAPPPATIQLFGSFGSSGTMRAMASAVNAVRVAAPSAGGISRSTSEAKSLRSSDFGGGSVKNGCSSARITQATSTAPCAASAALAIERLAHLAEHVIVEQRVARPGVAGDQDVGAVDIGDVGNAADIDHDDRAFALQRLRQRAVIDRHERRALPAGFDIGGAEIIHDRDMDRLGQRGGIADLHGHLLRRPVQHGLAVKADDIDVFAGDAVLRGKGWRPPRHGPG